MMVSTHTLLVYRFVLEVGVSIWTLSSDIVEREIVTE